MPKGKPWSEDQEKRLESWLAAGRTVQYIAEQMGKSCHAIRMKMKRKGLKVVVGSEKKICGPTSSFVLDVPEDLPSVEMQLRVLAGAIDKLRVGDLDKVDVMRLRGLIAGVKQYKELFADYVGYRELELKVEYALEWMRKRDEERKNLDRVKGQTE